MSAEIIGIFRYSAVAAIIASGILILLFNLISIDFFFISSFNPIIVQSESSSPIIFFSLGDSFWNVSSYISVMQEIKIFFMFRRPATVLSPAKRYKRIFVSQRRLVPLISKLFLNFKRVLFKI